VDIRADQEISPVKLQIVFRIVVPIGAGYIVMAANVKAIRATTEFLAMLDAEVDFAARVGAEAQPGDFGPGWESHQASSP
jgi:hypothetical protein